LSSTPGTGRPLEPNAISLDVAGVWMMLSAAVTIRLATGFGTSAGLALTPSAIPALVSALIVGLAGIETFRRRHLPFCVLVTASIALLNVVYVLAANTPALLVGVGFQLMFVLLLVRRRSAFQR
jgi:hypothetical protein